MINLTDKVFRGNGKLKGLTDERILISVKKPFFISRRFHSNTSLEGTLDFSNIYTKKQGIIQYLYLHISNEHIYAVNVGITIRINSAVIPYTSLNELGSRTHLFERIFPSEMYRVPFELNYPINPRDSRLEFDIFHSDDNGTNPLPNVWTIITLTGFTLP